MAGHAEGEATLPQVDDDLLVGEALHTLETLSAVVIADSATDPANTPTTTLRKGLVLCKIASGNDAGKYKEFDDTASDGSETDEDIVILAHQVADVDVAPNKVVKAYHAGTFKASGIKVSSGSNADPVWADVQRIVRR